MQTIEIKKENAINAFNSASNEVKNVLNILFGDDLMPKSIIDRVQSFDDVERISGIKLTKRPDETDDEFAYRQVKLIAEVYNEGDSLDPMNTNKYKYYPWHQIDNSSGSGLSACGYDSWFSTSCVGVRLCFKTKELAIDAGKKFIDIYSQLKIK